MRSDAQKRADSKYSKNNYCMISIKSRREFCLNERIEKASNDKGISKNAYLLSIIENALTDAGYPKPTQSQTTNNQP